MDKRQQELANGRRTGRVKLHKVEVFLGGNRGSLSRAHDAELRVVLVNASDFSVGNPGVEFNFLIDSGVLHKKIERYVDLPLEKHNNR